MDINSPELMEYFYELSVTLTGFSQFHLQGTGQGELYFKTIHEVIGPNILIDLLKLFHEIDEAAKNSQDNSIFTKRLRLEILGSEELGPIARNIIKLWYVATWYELPKAWREMYGTKTQDRTFIPSSTAYPEGLLWPAIGVNPPGAKSPGYASWSEKPSVGLVKSKSS